MPQPGKLPYNLSRVCTEVTMNNNKTLLFFLTSTLLVACGSDSDDSDSTRVPMPPAGFGDNNSLSAIIGTWHQTCSTIEGNLAKQQQVEFGKNTVRLTVLDYNDSGCSASNLVSRNVFIGKYQQEAEILTTIGNFSASPLDVIYTQSLSTVFSAGEVSARNKSRSCSRQDWAVGLEVDVSDWQACFPLFDIPQRQHYRLVRIEGLSQNEPKLFLDNPLTGYQEDGYPKRLDSDAFVPGRL